MVAVARVTKIRKSVDFRKYLFENWIYLKIRNFIATKITRYTVLHIVYTKVIIYTCIKDHKFYSNPQSNCTGCTI